MLIPPFENHREISELILIQRSSIFFPYFESKGFYFGPLFIVILRAVCFLINNCLTRSKFLMFVQAGWEPFQKYSGHPSISPRPIIFHFSHKRKKSFIGGSKNLKSRICVGSLGVPIFEVSQIGPQIRARIGYRSGTLSFLSKISKTFAYFTMHTDPGSWKLIFTRRVPGRCLILKLNIKFF